MLAEVALPLPLRRTFHYLVPEEARAKIRPGVRVRVPFGRRRLSGVCVGIAESTGVPLEALKPIERVLDEAAPALPAAVLDLARFVADYYRSGLGEALAAALPGSVKRRRRKDGKAATEGAALPPVFSGPPREHDRVLTAGQARALDAVSELLSAPRFGVVLVHGVTGSGKTEVYLRAIEAALARGKTALVLVPEIALTPQTIERFKSRIPSAGVLHSLQRPAERARQWERALSGESPLVVGPRSAVFAPLPRLGLVVVDEEHESSFKQDSQDPRYHARDVAIVRAKQEGAAVILGSATPSLESFENARSGRYRGVYLDERATGASLPHVEIVDLREEARERDHFPFLSRRLEAALRETLARKEQAILFLNRRGFSTFLRCRRCGHVFTCGECSVALTYHKGIDRALCHYCERRLDPPRDCPKCLAPAIDYFGVGTERIEEEVRRRFPGVAIERLDSDAIERAEDIEAALDRFRKGEVEILIGTQMVAKGLDFPRVTLVGVISADTALNFPDFRAAERTFQMLSQVAGRAGRGALEGRTVIQTFSPAHPSIRAAAAHDSLGFLETELAHRKKLRYPPFGRLALVTVSSPEESRLWPAAQEIAARIRAALSEAGVGPERARVLGPSPAPLFCLRGWHRALILLKGENRAAIRPGIEAFESAPRPAAGVRSALDIDPVNML
jgi:primosomal protein N' (replication factor Y)